MTRPVEGSKGTTQRDHLEKAAALGSRSAIRILQEEEPEAPAELEYLWTYFMELSLGRSTGLGGGELTYRDIDSWCRLMNRRLLPFEVTALLRIDQAFRNPGEPEEDR